MRVAAPFRARLFASVLRTAACGGPLQAANAGILYWWKIYQLN
jgi:hypothetical protein